MLRYGVADDKLPRSILDAEIDIIFKLGVKLEAGQSLGKDFGLHEINKEYDAVVIAVGTIDHKTFEGSGIDMTQRGIAVNSSTFETSVPGIFAGGNAIGERRMAIRAAAHGKFIAYSVDQFLNVANVTDPPHRFDSIMGRMQDGEIDEYIKESGELEGVEPEDGLEKGYSGMEAVRESTRCFHCDCRKRDTCKLRQYADEYGAEQRRFKMSERKRFQKIVQHDLVIYEPGKCIKCSLCVQITKNAGEELGLTFVNRGFDVRVETPFNETLDQGLKKVAGQCVEACPTSALSWRNHPEGSEYVER